MDRDAFERDGFLRVDGALTATEVEALRVLADENAAGRPGRRIAGDPRLVALLSSSGRAGMIAAELTSAAARPVRAVIFDKTEQANWSVGWHQDRTISVKARIETDGFGPWSMKDGALHVAPPFEVLSQMLTLRLHLDPVCPANAPLRVAEGSHQLGRVAAEQAATIASEANQHVCLANTGDIWVYRTPILHASDRSEVEKRRRVLQVDYADFDLPGQLEWRGLDSGCAL